MIFMWSIKHHIRRSVSRGLSDDRYRQSVTAQGEWYTRANGSGQNESGASMSYGSGNESGYTDTHSRSHGGGPMKVVLFWCAKHHKIRSGSYGSSEHRNQESNTVGSYNDPYWYARSSGRRYSGNGAAESAGRRQLDQVHNNNDYTDQL